MLDKIWKVVYWIGIIFGFCGLVFTFFAKCDSIFEKVMVVLAVAFSAFVVWLLN